MSDAEELFDPIDDALPRLAACRECGALIPQAEQAPARHRLFHIRLNRLMRDGHNQGFVHRSVEESALG